MPAAGYDVDLERLSEGRPLLEIALAPLAELLGQRFDWLWLGLLVVLAAAWVLGAAWRFSRPVADCLPRRVYCHRSARTDYACFLAFPSALAAAALAGWAPWSHWDVGSVVANVLDVAFVPEPPGRVGGLAVAAAFLGAVVLGDLSQYALHVAYHRVPWLWELHRTHHSALVLTPFTGAREHPLLRLADTLGYALMVGLYLGLLDWWSPLLGDRLLAAETGALAFALYAAAFLTSHYHLPVRFGGWERVLVSPGYHTAHHLDDPSYHQRNFGHLLTVWDRWFGTFRDPPSAREWERHRLGVEDAVGLDRWPRLWLVPLGRIARRAVGGGRAR